MGTGQPVTTPATTPAGLEAYVAELAGALRGPRGRRTSIVAEVHDGLVEAVDGYRDRGLSEERAVAAAIAEFGPATALADGFRDELAAVQARRTIAALLLTGPLVGIWWLLLLAPDALRAPTRVWSAIPMLPVIAAAAVLGMLVIATTGRLIRWVPETSPARAASAALVVGLTCVVIDLAVLTTLALDSIADQPPQPFPLAGIAAAASVTRVACTARALRGALTTS